MQNKEQKYHAYTARKRRRSVWNQLVRALACLVVFVTTYAMILPAITVSHEVICGYEEHTHSDDCYLVLNCGQEESETHTHTDDCYILGPEPVCGLTAHTHSEECYAATENWLTNLGIMLLGDSDDNDDDSSSSGAAAEIQDLNNRASLSVTKDKETDPDAEYDPTTDAFSVLLRVDCTLTKAEIEKADRVFHYDLPEDVVISDSILNGTYTGLDRQDKEAFEYRFESYTDSDGNKRYRLHIEFLETYVENMPEDDDTEVKVYVKFNGTLDSSSLDEDGKLVIKSQDGIIEVDPGNIYYPPGDQTASYNIDTQKTSSYNMSENTLTYTVVVSSTKGTPETIDIKDYIDTKGLEIESLKNLAVTKTDANGNSSSVTASNQNFANNTLTFTLNGLDAHEYYTITYTYQLKDFAGNTDVWPYNTVTAESKDESQNQSIKDTANVSTHVEKPILAKYGQYSADKKGIEWTIVVNSSGINIAGYTLTDDMLKNLAESAVSITPSSGYHFTKDEFTGKVTGIVFDSTTTDGETASNTDTYTITYTTSQNQTTQQIQVSNTAVLTPPEGNPTIKGTSVYVPAAGSVDKNFSSQDGNTLNWTTALNIPSSGIAKDTTLMDQLGPDWSIDGNHWMTNAQLAALQLQLNDIFGASNFTLEVSTSTNKYDYGWTTFAQSDDDTAQYYNFQVTFTKDISTDALTSNPLTLTYSTTTDLSSITNSSTFKNTAYFGSNHDTAEYKYYIPVVKLDKGQKPGTTTVTSKNGVIGWYVRVIPGEGAKKITIEDTLPTGVTLTQIGIGTSSSVTLDSDYPSDNVFYTWDNLAGQYTVSQQTVTMIVTPKGSNDTFAKDQIIYVYYECQITDLPDQGESKTCSLTNNATVTIDDGTPQVVTQTQNVTVNRPVLVTKLDSNEKSDDVTQYTGDGTTVGWYVHIYLENDVPAGIPIVVEDYLPVGVTLSKIGIGGNTYNARVNCSTSVAAGAETGTFNSYGSLNSTYEITTDESTGAQKITVTTRDTNTIKSGDIYLYFGCDIRDMPLNGKLTNRADVSIDSESYGSDSQTQATNPEYNGIINKLSEWDSGNHLINYSVLINENGADLDGNSDTLNVVDEMSYIYDPNWYPISSQLVVSSVKLYYIKSDGTKGSEVSNHKWMWTFSDNSSSLNGNYGTLIHTINATVPDKTPLLLEYSYRISVNADSADFQVSNTATIYGDSATSDNQSDNERWTVSDVEGGVTLDTSNTYYFTKVQKGDYGFRLSGSVFTLYKWNGNDTEPTPVTDSDRNTVTYTSNSNGKFQVTNTEKVQFDKNTIYFIQETKAPTGYVLDSTTRYYFYFSDTNDTEHTLPTTIPAGAIDLSSAFGNVYVENEKNTTQITVDKHWGTGATQEPVTVQLYQVRSSAASNVTLYSGETVITDWNWGLSVPTTNYGGTFDPSQITQGGYLSVYYFGESNISLAFKDSAWNWYQINTPTSVSDTVYGHVATFDYNAIIGATLRPENSTGTTLGANNLAGLKEILVGSEDVSIVAVVWTPPGASNSGSSDSSDSEDAATGETTTSEYGDPITLSETGGWTHVFDNLPLYELDETTGAIKGYYSYYAVEEATGYIVSYSNGVALNPVTGGTITITNYPASITVNKVWDDGNSEGRPNEITFYLLKDNEKVGPYTLKSDNNWTVIINDLDANGTYTVEEKPVDGYTTSYTLRGNTWTITNTKVETTSITIKKVWSDTPSVGAITVNIYRNDELYRENVTITGSDWTLTVSDLPKYDSDGNAYTYTVEEVAVEGYTTSYSNNNGISSGTITITNTKDQTTDNKTSITVKKEWNTTAGNSVLIHMYQVYSTTPPSSGNTGSGGTESGGSDSTEPSEDATTLDYTAVLGFAGAPNWWPDPQGSVTTNITGPGTYTLSWTPPQSSSGFYSFYIDIENAYYALQGYTISNVKVTADTKAVEVNQSSIYLTCEWIKNESGEWVPGYSNFRIGLDSAVSTDLSFSSNLTVEFTLVAPTESGSSGGDSGTTETTESTEATEETTAPSGDDSGESTVQTGGTLYDTVTLYSTTGTENGYNWTYVWDNLPLYEYDSNGNIIGYYSYYVVEDTNIYTVTYDNDGPITEGTITVTNSLDNPSYELPKTGSLGTTPYITAGAAMTLGAALLMYSRKKRGKGAKST